MKRVIFTIPHTFPYGNAYAARARAMCKLFQSAGYETDILCDGETQADCSEKYGRVYGMERSYSRLAGLLFMPGDFARKLDQLLTEERYDLIVSAELNDRFGRILKVARKHRIPLVLESCEWYDIRSFRRGKLDIRYYQFKRCFEHTFLQADGVMAISRLLEQHYRDAGKKTMRLPGIHQMDKILCSLQCPEEDRLKLIFSGNIGGGKELFSDLLTAIASSQKLINGIQLDIYGPDRSSLLSTLDHTGRCAFQTLTDNLVFHGKIPQNQMTDAISQYDFGIFFRPDRRSSHAGFPTKLGECLGAGTPVITNDTGDISLILEDGVNGFLLPTRADSAQIQKVLERCLELSREEKESMRRAARASAERKLDYCCYVEQLKKFLGQL